MAGFYEHDWAATDGPAAAAVRAAQHVAIVDDDPDIVRLHERILAIGGHVPVVVAPAVALEWPDWSTVDAAIVDLCMPGISGAAVLAMLASNHPNVLRVLVTAAADVDLRLDAQVRVDKPYSLDDLLAALEPGWIQSR
jgi:DNA-binding NtrC family response regulator